MPHPPVAPLAGGRLLLDLGFQDLDGVIGSYLLPQEEGWTLIEAGPTTCRDRLLQGLEEAGVAPSEVRRVLVTHIHLDHAGALGALAQELPNAEFYAHEVGVPHLIDPRRLQESARRAWGPMSDQLWGTLAPVPAARLHPLQGGERLPLAKGAHLEVLATPGHARHHLSFYDSATRTVYTGDGAGILVPGSRHIRPAVPPPDLDVPVLLRSLAAMARPGPTHVAFSHYGVYPDAPARLEEAAAAVRRWVELAEEAARREPSVASITRALEAEERSRSAREGEPAGIEHPAQLISGLEVAAAGLLRFLQQNHRLDLAP